jgi:hypothetical protein
MVRFLIFESLKLFLFANIFALIFGISSPFGGDRGGLGA